MQEQTNFEDVESTQNTDDAMTILDTKDEQGNAVLWSPSTGAVRVLPDGDWLYPEKTEVVHIITRPEAAHMEAERMESR